MNPRKNDHKNSSFIGKILNIPLIQIISGIFLVNVPTFILRSITQFILSSLSIDNVAVKSFIIFSVRLLSVYFAYNFFVHIFEKRKSEEISINYFALKEFVFGSLLGLFTISTVMALMWITGNFTITGIDSSAPLLQSLFYHSFFAYLQDIVYFAIIFRISEKHLGSWIAIAIASIIFGFKHLLFPGYTLWSVIAQTIEAGILFSALFIISRRIWFIFGFHLVWNLIQYGLILGFGSDGLTPLFISEFSGSNLITGMPVGPEASLFTFFIGTAIGLLFLYKAYKKNLFQLPFWLK